MRTTTIALVTLAAFASIILVANHAHAYTNSYGSISYDSTTNTITITGNSSDGNAWNFYDIWHWCNIDLGGNASLVISSDSNATYEGTQYLFNCKLQVGDGTTETWFEDTGKQIVFSDNAIAANGQKFINILANAHFQLGTLIDASLKKTANGCSIVADTPVGYYYLYSAGDADFYSCSFRSAQATTYNIQASGAIFWNCLFDNKVQFFLSSNCNVYNAMFTNTLYGLNTVSNMIVERLTVIGGFAPAQFRDNGGNISGLYSRGTTYLCVMRNVNDQPATLIDADVDNAKVYWFYQNSSYPVYIKYSFSICVTDANGTAISGALVKLYDNNGTLLFEDTTDATGRLSNAHIITYSEYDPKPVSYVQSSPDKIFSPFRLVISKSGYATYEANITIDHPFIDTPFVLDALTYTYDDIMAFLQEKWNGYNASQIMAYLQNIDVNTTQIYNLLKLVDNNISLLYEIAEYINNTRWGNLTAQDIYNAIKNINASSPSNYSIDANFTYILLPDMKVKFIDESFATNPILNYSWNFGDNTTATAPRPLHTFNATGTYNVTLTITDIYGHVSTITKQIHVGQQVFTVASIFILLVIFALLFSILYWRYNNLTIGVIALSLWMLLSAIALKPIGFPYQIAGVIAYHVYSYTYLSFIFLGLALMHLIFLIVEIFDLFGKRRMG